MKVYPGKHVICVGGTRKGGGSPTMGFQQGVKMVALVTGLYPKGPVVEDQPSLSLLVFAPGALQFYAPMSVPYDASGAEGTWHFIPEEVSIDALNAPYSAPEVEPEPPPVDIVASTNSLPIGKRMAETK